MTLRTGCPPRLATPRTLSRSTLGPAVGEVARLLGKPFMPWQQLVADVVLEVDPETGRLAYQQFGLTVPRQSGKSTWVLAKALHRGLAGKFFGPRQKIVYTAQTRKDARKKWEEDFAPDIEASSALKRRVPAHWGNGHEHMRFPNGSRFGLESTTEKSGHGPTLDEAYIDEAFAQVDGRSEQAFRPAMITRPNTQLGVISTAGWAGGSPYLWAQVQRGRSAVDAGMRSGLAYFEWSAPEDCEPDDPEVWRACMPALGYTISEESIAGELASMDLADFQRAYLNLWVPKPVLSADGLGIDPARWAERLDPNSTFGPDRTCLAVDITPDRAVATIGGTGTNLDGVRHVEVLEELPATGDVLGAVLRAQERRRCPVVIDPGSHARTLIADLTAAGVQVVQPALREIAAACGAFYDRTEAGTLAHLGQPTLNDAVAGATTKAVSGGWKWYPKGASSISPLYAVTLALYGYETDNQGGWMVGV